MHSVHPAYDALRKVPGTAEYAFENCGAGGYLDIPCPAAAHTDALRTVSRTLAALETAEAHFSLSKGVGWDYRTLDIDRLREAVRHIVVTSRNARDLETRLRALLRYEGALHVATVPFADADETHAHARLRAHPATPKSIMLDGNVASVTMETVDRHLFIA